MAGRRTDTVSPGFGRPTTLDTGVSFEGYEVFQAQPTTVSSPPGYTSTGILISLPGNFLNSCPAPLLPHHRPLGATSNEHTLQLKTLAAANSATDPNSWSPADAPSYTANTAFFPRAARPLFMPPTCRAFISGARAQRVRTVRAEGVLIQEKTCRVQPHERSHRPR